MPDGRDYLNDAEYDNLIRNKNDRDLLEFTAWQSYRMSRICDNHEKRIKSLEKLKRQTGSIWGTAGAFIGGAAVAITDFMMRR